MLGVYWSNSAKKVGRNGLFAKELGVVVSGCSEITRNCDLIELA